MANPRKDITPSQIYIPVFIPTEDGVGEIELGKATIRSGTLLVEFNNKLPSVAIQHRIERGGIIGLSFVIPELEAAEARVAEDERKNQQEEDLSQTDRDVRDLEALKSDDELTPEDLATD